MENKEIESWIILRGERIPKLKGQTKEEAVYEYVKNKYESGEWYLTDTKTGEKYFANKKTGKFEKENKKDKKC